MDIDVLLQDALMFASAELKADKETVLAAVAQYGRALGHASAELQADKEVVLVAVAKDDGYAICFASSELKADKEVALAAVTTNGCALGYVSAGLLADKEVVFAALMQNSRALTYSSEFSGDKDILLAAVTHDGDMLEYASEELQADKEVVLAAVAQSERSRQALQYASPHLRDGGFEAYLSELFSIYSVPVLCFLSTVLFASMLPLAASHSTEAAPVTTTTPPTARMTRRCAHKSSGLQKLNALGPEGAMAFKKRIAAFAGVPCRDMCHMPWSSVRAAARAYSCDFPPGSHGARR